MRGHNLVWTQPQHNAPFVDGDHDATKLKAYMDGYITKTVDTIGSYPIVWDVVNEVFSNSSNPDKVYNLSPYTIIGGAETKGKSWVCQAFKTARKANPGIKLFYNDDMIASNVGKYKKKSDEAYELVKFLKE